MFSDNMSGSDYLHVTCFIMSSKGWLSFTRIDSSAMEVLGSTNLKKLCNWNLSETENLTQRKDQKWQQVGASCELSSQSIWLSSQPVWEHCILWILDTLWEKHDILCIYYIVTRQTTKDIADKICQYCDEEREKKKYELVQRVHFDQFRILKKM